MNWPEIQLRHQLHPVFRQEASAVKHICLWHHLCGNLRFLMADVNNNSYLVFLLASRGYVARFTATSSPSSRVKLWSCLMKSSDIFMHCPSQWGDRSLHHAPCPSCSARAGPLSAASRTAMRKVLTLFLIPSAASQLVAPTRLSKPQELSCSAATSALSHLFTELIPSTAMSHSHLPHHRQPSRLTTTSHTMWPITLQFCTTTWTFTGLSDLDKRSQTGQG